MIYACCVLLKKSLPISKSQSQTISPIFYSRSFIGLHFSIWFISNYFIHSIRKGWVYFFPYPLSSTIFWKKLCWIILPLLLTDSPEGLLAWLHEELSRPTPQQNCWKWWKNNHLLSLEIFLWINNKWRNIYSRTFLFW